MTDQSITSLIEKLEGAETGARELDWLIADATGHPSFARKIEGIWPPFMERSRSDKDVPAYTTSLDAALALAERFWPGQEYEITTLYGVARVTLNMNHGDQAGPHYGHNDCGHVPSAICAAIIRAQSEACATGEDSPANEGEGR